LIILLIKPIIEQDKTFLAGLVFLS